MKQQLDLKNLAQGREMDFDMDQVWSHLDRKKRRFPIWIFFLGSMTLLAITGWIFRSNGSGQDKIKNFDETISLVEPMSTPGNVSSLIIQDDINQAENNKDSQPVTSSHKQAPIVNTSTHTNKRVGQISMKEEVSSTHTAKDLLNTTQQKEAIGESHDIQHSVDLAPELITEQTTFNISPTVAVTRAQVAKVLDQVDFMSIRPISPNIQLSTKDVLREEEGKGSRNRRDWSKCEVRLPWSSGLEVYGGYTQPLSSYSLADSDGGSGSNYLTRWNEVESMVGGFHGGISAFLQSPSGVEMMLGVDYTRMEDKLSLHQVITERIRYYDEMAYFYTDSIGNRVWVGDTVTTTRITERTQINGKTRQMISVPIRIGYMHRGDQWNIGGHLGATVHIYQSYQGPILRSDNSLIEVDNQNFDQFFNDQIRVSFSADLHLGRQLNDDWELFFRPEFRFFPDSWTNDQNILDLDMHLGMATVGIRHHF